jgi:hypothetical protein
MNYLFLQLLDDKELRIICRLTKRLFNSCVINDGFWKLRVSFSPFISDNSKNAKPETFNSWKHYYHSFPRKLHFFDLDNCDKFIVVETMLDLYNRKLISYRDYEDNKKFQVTAFLRSSTLIPYCNDGDILISKYEYYMIKRLKDHSGILLKRFILLKNIGSRGEEGLLIFNDYETYQFIKQGLDEDSVFTEFIKYSKQMKMGLSGNLGFHFLTETYMHYQNGIYKSLYVRFKDYKPRQLKKKNRVAIELYLNPEETALSADRTFRIQLKFF